MKLQRYSEFYKEECLNIFSSNTPKYFAKWEYTEFENFLDKFAKNEMFYVLRENGRVVGCGGYEVNNDCAILTWGMIHCSLHKKHLGTRLLELRKEEIRKDKTLKKIEIETSQKSQGFFEKKGFKILNVVQDGFAKGLDKVVMELKI